MMHCSPEFIQALKNPNKEFYVKLEFYSNKMEYLDEFSKRVADDVGQISVDMSRDIKRSFSFKLLNHDGLFTWGEDNLLWIDKRVKLYTGLKLWNGQIEYIPQGIFIVSEPSDTHNTSGKITEIMGVDKTFLYTDKRGKFINDQIIQEGTLITDAIRIIASHVGETLFNFDDIPDEEDRHGRNYARVPYELNYSATDNRWNGIKELADLARCIVYYDVYGYLRLQRIDLNRFEQEPTTWTYQYSKNIDDPFYAGNERKLNESNLSNWIRVLGGSGQSAEVTYDLVVDEESLYDYTITDSTKRNFDNGIYTNTMYNSNPFYRFHGLSLGLDGVNYSKAENTKSDFQTGTLSNLYATDDNTLELVNGQSEGHRILPTINLSTVNKIGSSQITWNFHTDYQGVIKVETRFSTNNGSTWSDWSEQPLGGEIVGLTKGMSAIGLQIQVKQILTRNNNDAKLGFSSISIHVNSAYKTSGSYISSELVVPNIEKKTKRTYVTFVQDLKDDTNINIEIRRRLGNNTWSNWVVVNNDDTIDQFTDEVDISDFTFQYRLNMSTNDVSVTPILREITFHAEVEGLWKDNPYSIQRIGRITHFHQEGNFDPLIRTTQEAKWRAKFELLNRLGYAERVSLNIAPNYLHDIGDIIEVVDENNSVQGKYMIDSMSVPIKPQLMTIQCYKYRKFLTDWEAL